MKIDEVGDSDDQCENERMQKHFRSNPLPANNAANALRIESDLERRETNTRRIL